MIILNINDIKTLVKILGHRKIYLDLVEQMKIDFGNWEAFHKYPRHVTYYPDGVIELMPTADHDYYGYKYMNGHPNNPKLKKPTVMATGQLSSSFTGEPLFFTEMTFLTAFRNAATSALAGEYLINKGADTMAIIGTGSQSEFQALAFHFTAGIKNIRYFDLDSSAMDKFAHNLKAFSLNLIPCKSTEEALDGAQIITTLTAAKKKTQVVTLDQVQPGVFFNGVGGDSSAKTEVDPEILRHSKVVVEYTPQTILEGEIQNVGPEVIYAELWEIIQGQKPGRTSAEEITFFDSVGFAIEDFSILKLFYRYAQEHQVGTKTTMVPDPKDPHDIFSMFE